MIKVILGILAGIIGWVFVGFVGLLTLRISWPDYANAIDDFAFTVPMLLARLVVGFLSSFAAGWAVFATSKNMKVVWCWGAVFLLYACYMHFVVLWSNFPVWFHFSYITTLLPVIILGGFAEEYRVNGNLKTSVA